MSKEEKKSKKGKKKILILLILIVIVGGIIWFLGDDEEYYDDGRFYGEENYQQNNNHDSSQNSSQNVSNGGTVDRQEISSLLDTSAVREHQVKLKGNGEDTVTIMLYVNGSNLESDDGEATTDLNEVIKGAGVSDKVNILVQTMGTKTWQKELGIASDRSQRYKLDGNGLTLLKDDLGQQDCTVTETLSDFIKWSAANFPADRYMLVFWDHGGGAVYGFGYDEWANEDDTLTLDEIQDALKDAGVFFDFIGMDCCIMSSLETCCAFYDYCDYTILSEDFESGLGWYYTNWINTLYNNTSVSTQDLGTQIADDLVSANASDSWGGDDSILAVIDESMIKVLYETWKEFAFDNKDKLLEKNYSRAMKPKNGGRVHPKLTSRYGFDFFEYFSSSDDEDYTLEDYFEVDIMSAASSISSASSETLKAAVNAALVHVAYTSGDANYTGLAVSLPYGDSNAYTEMQSIFSKIGLDAEYIAWLQQFTTASGANNYYDYDNFDESWDGWEDYEDDYDWSLWDLFDDDEYWEDDDNFGFSDWDYNDSYNEWYDDYGCDDNYHGDWYYDDDYCGDYYYYDDDGSLLGLFYDLFGDY